MSQARFEVVFYGHVQGVGFRMTAARCAEMLGLVGWVRNEPDGSVRLVMEGTEGELDALVDRIEEHLPGHVDRKTVAQEAKIGEFTSFRILRSESHR